MSKKDEALKLALEALEAATTPLAKDRQEVLRAQAAIREALAEQETVLPGGGHVPAVPVAVYGYCPECGGAGVMRERRPNGDDKCTNGHKYPSSKALAEQPAQQQEPVAWLHTKIEGVAVPHRPADLDKHPDRWTALYPEPKPCPTCEALARTVMMDQTAHDKQRKPWAGLTDEEYSQLHDGFHQQGKLLGWVVDQVEAKLREKNA